MSVRLICNGYFRSGTTIIWRILKESNKDCLVFYEPCHERLFIHLERFNGGRRIRDLHGVPLWEEYFKKEGFIDRLRFTHPNVGALFPEDIHRLVEYVRVFDSLEEHTILQVNRWHFHLRDLKRNFPVSLLHIIRNPVDIFNSFHSNYIQNKKPLIIFLKKHFKVLFFGRAFNQKLWFREIYRRFGKPSFLSDKLEYMIFELTRPFDAFLVVWVLANTFALKSLGERDLLMIYECLIRNPDHYKQRMRDLFGLDFAYDRLLKREPARSKFLTDDEYTLLTKKAERFGLQEEFEFVVNSIRNCEHEIR